MSLILDPSQYRVLWSGRYLGGSLAIVTADPAACEIAWSLTDFTGDQFQGTMTLQNQELVTPEMKIKIILASIKQEYEADQMARKLAKTTHHGILLH